ncbi:MAG: FtsH protease activity modulator HflK [Planctomycetes bacterium]|nr:FtsH protease activity modulator HflK [Planctomycetota bacterium]
MSQEFDEALAEFKLQFRRHWRMGSLVLGALAVFSLANSVFYSVDTSEKGVVLRFGAIVDTTLPGLHLKLPWPVDQVIKVPVQEIKSMDFGFGTIAPGRQTSYRQPNPYDLHVAEMLTGDQNLAHVEWVVQYRIGDAAKYLFALSSGELAISQRDAVEDTIRDASESVMRQLVGDVSVDEVLTFGRDAIASNAKRELQKMLDRFDCGINIVTLKLQSVSPPEPVKDAFDSVNRARQNKERVVNDALGERNRLIPEARGRRDRTIAEAEGYEALTVRAATGHASAFLAKLEEYRKAPEVTRTRLYLEALEDMLQRVDDLLIIDRSVSSPLPLLNLNPVKDRSPQALQLRGQGGAK